MASTPATSSLSSFFLADKTVRGVILDGTPFVQEMRNRHTLGALETRILGQALLVTVLMGSTLKGEDETSLRIDCSGPIKGLVAEATAAGEARGYLKQVPIPLTSSLESLDITNQLAPLWGQGLLTITRFLEKGRQPFSSSEALQSGDIAAEVARYYRVSEQIATALHAAVFLNKDGEVAGAGGLLLQAMPGGDESIFTALEQKTKTLPSLAKALAEGHKAFPWLTEHFAPHKPYLLETHPVFYRCRCNDSRMRLVLLQLSLADLEDMRDNGPFPIILTCHFCNQQYPFDQKALTEICREKQARI